MVVSEGSSRLAFATLSEATSGKLAISDASSSARRVAGSGRSAASKLNVDSSSGTFSGSTSSFLYDGDLPTRREPGFHVPVPLIVPRPTLLLWPIIHEPGGGPNTQRRVRSGLRQIHTFPSGLGDASSNGTNSVSRTTQPLPVTATRSGDSQSLSPQHHSPTGFRYAPRLIQES